MRLFCLPARGLAGWRGLSGRGARFRDTSGPSLQRAPSSSPHPVREDPGQPTGLTAGIRAGPAGELYNGNVLEEETGAAAPGPRVGGGARPADPRAQPGPPLPSLNRPRPRYPSRVSGVPPARRRRRRRRSRDVDPGPAARLSRGALRDGVHGAGAAAAGRPLLQREPGPGAVPRPGFGRGRQGRGGACRRRVASSRAGRLVGRPPACLRACVPACLPPNLSEPRTQSDTPSSLSSRRPNRAAPRRSPARRRPGRGRRLRGRCG